MLHAQSLPTVALLTTVLGLALSSCDSGGPASVATTPATKAAPASSAAQPNERPLVRWSAELYQSPEGANVPPEIAAHFEVAPGWHIYWENPGDSGLPTKITSKQATLGPTRYPMPEVLRDDSGTVSYAYEHETTIFASLPDAATRAGQTLELSASWLVCDPGGCIRGNGLQSLKIPATVPAMPEATRAVRQTVPTAAQAGLAVSVERTGPAQATVHIELPEGAKLERFLPLATQPAVYIDHTLTGRSLGVRYSNVPSGGESVPPWAARLGVVAFADARGTPALWEVGL